MQAYSFEQYVADVEQYRLEQKQLPERLQRLIHEWKADKDKKVECFLRVLIMDVAQEAVFVEELRDAMIALVKEARHGVTWKNAMDQLTPRLGAAFSEQALLQQITDHLAHQISIIDVPGQGATLTWMGGDASVSSRQQKTTPTEAKTESPSSSSASGEIDRLLAANADNTELFWPLQDSAWIYHFQPSSCHLSVQAEYLDKFFADAAVRAQWKEVGWGRDRDVGSCRLLVNTHTGELAQYSYSDVFNTSWLMVFHCTLAELVQAFRLLRNPAERASYEVRDFLRAKLRKHTVIEQMKTSD